MRETNSTNRPIGKKAAILLSLIFCLSLLAFSSPVFAASGISITKMVSTTGHPSGSPGTSSNFRIDIKNSGDSQLSSVTLTDLMPYGITYSGASTTPTSWSLNPNGTTTITWSLGSMNPGASKTIYPRGFRNGMIFGPLTNIATVTGIDASSKVITTQSTCVVTALKPDIKIIESVSPSYGSTCSEVTFNIKMENAGNDTLSSIRVIDLLPSGLSYEAAGTANPPNYITSYANGSTNLTWTDLGYMGISGTSSSKTISFKARLNGQSYGQINDKIEALAKPPNLAYPIYKNSYAEISALRSSLNVSEAKPRSHLSGAPGAEIEFDINITNTGEVPLSLVNLTDILPKGLTYVSSSPQPSKTGRTVQWTNLGDIAPGSSFTVRMAARIDGSAFGTLENTIIAAGKPISGCNVTDEESCDVIAYRAGLQIIHTPYPASGVIGSNIDFKIDITNTGEVDLNAAKITDLLPKGLSYSSSSVDPTEKKIHANGSCEISWSNILASSLSPGESKSLNLIAKIDGNKTGILRNNITAIVCPPSGYNIVGQDWNVVTARKSGIEVIEVPISYTTDLEAAVDFKIEISNTGDVDLKSVKLVDLLPKGLRYSSASIHPDSLQVNPNGSATITWNNILSASLGSNSTAFIHLETRKDGTTFGDLQNTVLAIGMPEMGNQVQDIAYATVNAVAPSLSVNKTSSKKIVNRGDEINYIIQINNLGDFPAEDVTVKDVFDSRVEFISASPMPDGSGVWHFDVIGPHSTIFISLCIQVPITQIAYNADQKIIGKGFVNVAQDYSTTFQQYALNNQVLVNAKGLQSSARESVTVSSEPGTELKSREHGSGNYSHDEIDHLCTKNRSIEASRILNATAHPTTFALPGKRSANFSSRWFELTSAKNRITDTSTTESYAHACRINHSSILKLDENGTDIDVSADLEGTAHLGFLKRSTDGKSDFQFPFKSSEDYEGSFRISENLDESGEEVMFSRSANGSGTVYADKHIRHSQKTYESGSGDYQIGEIIDTPTSFMAKEVELLSRPTKYRYSPTLSMNSSRLWKEGMRSKAENSGHIGEEYEDLKHLQKKTVMAGLNQIETAAIFSGRSRFEAGSEDTVRLAEERAGNFSLTRKLLLKGVSRYDRPHITLTIDGRTRIQRINGQNITVADYEIAMQNDGNVSLGPVYVRDLLPIAAQFINSSIKPEKMDGKYINWTFVNMGIGSFIKIDLRLKVNDKSADLVNRAEACGAWDSHFVCAANTSSLQFDWLPCCPPEIHMTKTARIDPSRPTVVSYAIFLENRGNGALSAEITDRLPDGLEFLNSTLSPSEESQSALVWRIINISAGESRSIEFWAKAFRNGRFVNLANADAWIIGGQGSASAQASAEVVMDGVHEKKDKSKPDSHCLQINSTNEPRSVYDWNLEPLAECQGPCPAFYDSLDDDDIPQTARR